MAMYTFPVSLTTPITLYKCNVKMSSISINCGKTEKMRWTQRWLQNTDGICRNIIIIYNVQNGWWQYRFASDSQTCQIKCITFHEYLQHWHIATSIQTFLTKWCEIFSIDTNLSINISIEWNFYWPKWYINIVEFEICQKPKFHRIKTDIRFGSRFPVAAIWNVYLSTLVYFKLNISIYFIVSVCWGFTVWFA